MGKKGSDLSKSARQELLINILKVYGTGEGIKPREIHELILSKGIQVNIRTIYRDLQDLSRFPSLSEVGAESDKKWVWSSELETKNFMNELREEYLKEIVQFIRTEAI